MGAWGDRSVTNVLAMVHEDLSSVPCTHRENRAQLCTLIILVLGRQTGGALGLGGQPARPNRWATVSVGDPISNINMEER